MAYRSVSAKLILVLFLSIFFTSGALSQHTSTLSLTSLASTDRALPFWMAANQFAAVDPGSGNLIFRATISGSGPETRSLNYLYAMDAMARASDNGSVYMHQFFAGVRYKAIVFSAGWRERTFGLVDSTLSMGSMLISRNAATIPRISLDTRKFISIPGTSGNIAFKAHWAHGWLERDRFVRSPLIHEKSLHLRFLNPKRSRTTGVVGLSHFVVWGGTHPTFGRIPTSFSDYIDVILARSGDEGNIETDPQSRLGNAAITVDFALTRTFTGSRLLLYRQYYMEAGSDMQFRNAYDGIWGISFKRTGSHRIAGIVWEFLYTKRQGAKQTKGDPMDFSAYYMNGIYQTGWTYRGRTLGNPLLFSDGSLRRPVKNTILVAHHVGIEGMMGKSLSYRTLFTYSRNYGTRDDCGDDGCTGSPKYSTPRTDQYSILFEVQGQLPLHPALNYQAAIAMDLGALYPDRAGLKLGVVWTGWMKR